MIKIKGFTLAEILIVVVILGILATLVLPRFFGQEERGIVAEAVAKLSAIRQGEEAYKLESPAGAYIASTDAAFTWDLLGIDNPDNARFVYTVDAAGASTATRQPAGDCATAPFNGCTIILAADGTWDATASHPYKPT